MFRLYAIFQTAPQLFDALNEYLPKDKQLECENEFWNAKEIDLPIFSKILGNDEDTKIKKCLQLSPYLLKEQPLQIKEHCFDCITQDNLFASEDEKNAVYGIFSTAPDGQCGITSPVHNKELQRSPVISIRPKNTPNGYPP